MNEMKMALLHMYINVHDMCRLVPSMANTGNPDSCATEGQYIKQNVPFSNQ